MGLTVTTISPTRLLTTVSRVKVELNISVSTHDTFLDTLVRQASAMAETYCSRVFVRQKYTETTPTFGGPHHALRQAPVIVLDSSTYDGQTMTDVSVVDVDRGFLWREEGFFWTAQRYSGLQAGGGWLDQGIPVHGSEERLWSFVYHAGFIVPAQNVLSVATVSVDTADDSFNNSASGFPSLLKSGDVIETSGFTNAANNGRFVVTGTPTTAKIQVSGDLTTETAAAGRTVLVSSLPGDVERAVIETVKSMFARRSTDAMIESKSLGPASISYGGVGDSPLAGLPPTAIGLLQHWRRRVAS